MAAYDPKRPRRDLDEDVPAPVDALLEAGPTGSVDASSVRSDTPTAPAPDAGTANPAVVVAGLAGLVTVLVLLVVWLRRRR